MTWKRRGGFWGTLGCLVGLHDGGDPRMIYPPFCTRCGKRDLPRSHQVGNVVHGDMAGGDIVKNEQPNAPAEGSGAPATDTLRRDVREDS